MDVCVVEVQWPEPLASRSNIPRLSELDAVMEPNMQLGPLSRLLISGFDERSAVQEVHTHFNASREC